MNVTSVILTQTSTSTTTTKLEVTTTIVQVGSKGVPILPVMAAPVTVILKRRRNGRS